MCKTDGVDVVPKQDHHAGYSQKNICKYQQLTMQGGKDSWRVILHLKLGVNKTRANYVIQHLQKYILHVKARVKTMKCIPFQ